MTVNSRERVKCKFDFSWLCLSAVVLTGLRGSLKGTMKSRTWPVRFWKILVKFGRDSCMVTKGTLFCVHLFQYQQRRASMGTHVYTRLFIEGKLLAFGLCLWRRRLPYWVPQWGDADAEMKVPSGENTELERSLFKTWSRSVYSRTCYAYCQGFLLCLFLPFLSIQLHFFQNLSRFFLRWLWLTHGSCVGPQNKIGHLARGRFPCWVPTEYK